MGLVYWFLIGVLNRGRGDSRGSRNLAPGWVDWSTLQYWSPHPGVRSGSPSIRVPPVGPAAGGGAMLLRPTVMPSTKPCVTTRAPCKMSWWRATVPGFASHVPSSKGCPIDYPVVLLDCLVSISSPQTFKTKDLL